MRVRHIGKFILLAGLSGMAALPATAAEAASDTLRVAHVSLPQPRGVPSMNINTPVGYTWSAIFDTMVYANAEGAPAGRLAESWQAVDPTTWHFKLRPNVTFSNGEPFTADAVVAWLNWFRSDAGQATNAGRDARPWNGAARAVDPLTVEIKTPAPLAILPYRLFTVRYPAPKAFAEMGVEGFANKPVGTGPFMVQEWTPDQVRMTAYDKAWRPAKVKNLVIAAVPEMAARGAALQSGQVDAVTGLSLDLLQRVKAAGMQADTYAAPYIMSWGLISYGKDTPFKDVRVRRAMNHAVNRQAIITNLLHGEGFTPDQGATRMTFGYNPNVKPYAFDPALAKKLLADAGYPNGFAMAVEVLPGNFAADGEIYQQVAQDLGKVGVQVELRPITMADYIKKTTSDATKLIFDDKVYAFQQDIGLEGEDVTRAYRSYSCRRKPALYCDEAELKAVEAAEAEFDIVKRKAMYQALMQRFHDNAPALFLTELTDVVARSPKVKGFTMVQRVINYNEVELTD